MKVKDSTILVTGANRGIGASFVDAFLRSGAKKVYAAVRDLDSLCPCENDGNGNGGDDDDGNGNGNDPRRRIVPLRLDLGDPDSVARAAEEASDADAVVNCAGILTRTGPLDADVVDRLEEEMAVNVYGFVRLSRAYVDIWSGRPSRPAAFVQVNSVASFRVGGPEVSTYSASKAAAYSMTQGLRQSTAGTNVRILSVHPGPIRTDMLKGAGEEIVKEAEPAERVTEAVIRALEGSEDVFHVFPDSKAANLGRLIEPLTKTVVEEGNAYGV